MSNNHSSTVDLVFRIVIALAGLATMASLKFVVTPSETVMNLTGTDLAPSQIVFIKHWGLPYKPFGLMLVSSAFMDKHQRAPILWFALAEKLSFVGFVLFGSDITKRVESFATGDLIIAIIIVSYIFIGRNSHIENMRMQLASGEKIIDRFHKSWSTYSSTGLWAVFGIIVFGLAIQGNALASSLAIVAAIFFSPFALKLYANRRNENLVTNSRMHIEKAFGVRKRDISISEIREINTKSNFLQKLFHSGNVI